MKTKLIASIFIIICFIANLIAGLVLKDDANTLLLRRAKEMLSFMNQSVDPCDNFYEFTCGQWSNVYPADSDDTIETNYLKKVVETFDEKVIEMLSSEVSSEDLEHDKKVKRFFKSCSQLKNGVFPEKIIKLMSEFGTMPAVVKNSEDWNADEFDWINTLAKIIEKYGYPIIIAIGVDTDLKDNSSNRLYIGRAEFELESKSVYLEPMGKEYRNLYKWVVASNMHNLLNISLTDAIVVAEQILDFEVKLAKGMLNDKADRSVNNLLIETTAEEMQQKYAPTIDIKRLLTIIFGEVPEGMIYEYLPGYLQNVKEVIEKAEKRDVANYLFYHLIRRFNIDDIETKAKLEKNCLTIVKKQFYKAIDNMFYRHFLDDQVKAAMQDVWKKIKDTFRTKLVSTETIEWFTTETRAKALEKLEALQLIVNTYEDYDFAKDFDNLTLTQDDFVGNLQEITHFDNSKSLRKLHEPVTKFETGDKISGTAVNLLIENTVYVPVSMLQPYSIWAPNYPDAMIYALAGFFLAHELIHSFDDTGRQFGKTGKIEDWWDTESTQQFLDRRTCFTEQYHGYVYGKNPLPKSERQSENIADNGGLKLAYDTFIKHTNNTNNNNSHGLQNFPYSDKQLFFISYGQLWCSDIQARMIDLQTATDNHTPGKFRNIGTVSNSEDFTEAFNCAIGSKMNPEKKCKIYR